MMRIISFFFVFISLYKLDAQQLPSLAAANALVEKQEFESAIQTYHEIISGGDISAELHYNLANVYLGVDSVAEAILHYEKALRISPHDEDIINNLEIARSRVEDQLTILPEFFIISYWKYFYNIMNADLWAIASIVALLLLVLVIYFTFYKGIKWQEKKWLLTYGILIIFFILSLSAGWARKMHDTSPNEAIIYQQVFMKSGPDYRSDDLKLLRPGYKVIIIDKLNGWNKIRTEDREEGWIKPEILRII